MSALAPERAPQSSPRATPRPKLHLITRSTPEARARRAPKTPFVILLLTLLAGGLVGLLLLNTVIDQDAFTLHDLQSKQTALDVTEASLHETANSDADPAALAVKAAALGMIPAGPPVFVKAGKLPKNGKLVGNLYIVTGTPTPAPTAAPAAAPAAAPTRQVTTATTGTATRRAVPSPAVTTRTAPSRSTRPTSTATTRATPTHVATTRTLSGTRTGTATRTTTTTTTTGVRP